jgi:hypothetical protein
MALAGRIFEFGELFELIKSYFQHSVVFNKVTQSQIDPLKKQLDEIEQELLRSAYLTEDMLGEFGEKIKKAFLDLRALEGNINFLKNVSTE